MEFIIKRDALLKSLNLVQGIIEKKNTLPILSNVLLEAKNNQLSIIATDLDLIFYDNIHETMNELRMGNIWMLGSNKLNTIRKSFYKTSKKVVNWLSEEFDYLENVVPLSHKKTILWLSLLGFDVGKGIITINNTECVRFVRCAPNIQVSFQ